MPLLLAAFVERHAKSYRLSKFFGTLMRHFLAVGALAIGVAQRAQTTALIAAPRRAQRCAPRLLPTPRAAIAVATIAATTQEKDLAALRPATDDKAQRVHVGVAALEKLDAVARP
jgi:hypothetical protein